MRFGRSEKTGRCVDGYCLQFRLHEVRNTARKSRDILTATCTFHGIVDDHVFHVTRLFTRCFEHLANKLVFFVVVFCNSTHSIGYPTCVEEVLAIVGHTSHRTDLLAFVVYFFRMCVKTCRFETFRQPRKLKAFCRFAIGKVRQEVCSFWIDVCKYRGKVFHKTLCFVGKRLAYTRCQISCEFHL